MAETPRTDAAAFVMNGEPRYSTVTGAAIKVVSADFARQLEAENLRLREALAGAGPLRPALLKQLGYVPECVLNYCNAVRAILKRP